MKKQLLIALLAGMTLGANAQEKVHQYFKVSDGSFNVANFQDESNPNECNVVKNSFTIPTAFGSVGWNWGNWWSSDGTLDISKYDKLVIRLASVVGNNLQFRIFAWNADGNTMEYDLPDDIVEFDEETEYEVDLTEDLYCANDAHLGEPLDKEHILSFVFWNYWSTGQKLDENGDVVYDEETGEPLNDDDPSVTVTISAMYLERTLANGEKDYVDLLAANKMQFSDSFLDDDGDDSTSGSYMDNAGIMHVNENATPGIYFEDEPADWSAYKYLIVVPQAPADDSQPVVDYTISDYDDNVFQSGRFRYGVWNKTRAAVLDLSAILTTPNGDSTDDEPEYLEEFDTKNIFSFGYSYWGGVASWEYGVAAIYLSNTAPTYSTGFGEGTDQTGDYVRDNAAENTISTVCLPFSAACCGAQVYEVAGVDNLETPTELYAKPHVGILEAGKPYILRSNSARNITFFRAGANELSEPIENGALLAGSFQTYYVQADQNYCVLNADGDTFEAVTSKSKRVNSNTAYIDCNKLSVSEEQENGLVFSLSGVTKIDNGIAGITVDNKGGKQDNAIYDLMGRKVTTPSKGIYIKNGKKFVVK